MSKSNPDSAIFMTDTTDEVKRKFSKAFCPEKQVEDNPVLEYCKHIVFNRDAVTGNPDVSVTLERPEKFGGNRTFASYAELEAAYVAGEVHPMDLKGMTAKYIDALLEPVRQHFATDARAGALRDAVRSYQITK
jgi:tyrosyl-tRNA synthetase